MSKEEDLAKLRRDFEGNEEVNYILEPTLGRSGTILVSPSALKKLLGTGVNVTVLNENFQRTIDEERRQTISVRQVGLSRDVSSYFHTFPRHSEINDFIALLARTNSSLALIETIGRSYENRPMNVIKIGKNHQSRQKPVIWIDAGIHAREWAAPQRS
ncbi:carboxypeptidase B-like protein [Dinothrombium tinctorium]|uniref:Carboxypeptidase B-like protein n=1 Tax=Dinothrombium tinctorium TaxID=1965070 RepID=A0A443REU3_9ACAR|nr:carboxypeptidase B-like protein [Dinothrombium tinctorium]